MVAKLDRFCRQDEDPQAKDGGFPSSPSTTCVADKAEILEGITTCQASLTTRIEEMKVDISLVHQDMQHLLDRVGESAQCLGALPLLHESADQAHCLIAQLQQKQDDLKIV